MATIRKRGLEGIANRFAAQSDLSKFKVFMRRTEPISGTFRLRSRFSAPNSKGYRSLFLLAQEELPSHFWRSRQFRLRSSSVNRAASETFYQPLRLCCLGRAVTCSCPVKSLMRQCCSSLSRFRSSSSSCCQLRAEMLLLLRAARLSAHTVNISVSGTALRQAIWFTLHTAIQLWFLLQTAAIRHFHCLAFTGDDTALYRQS